MNKSSFIALSAILFYSCTSAQERITINLKKGQVYTQTMISKSSNEQTIQGKESKSSSISETSSRNEVIGVKDSLYTIRVTYKTLVTTVISNGDTIKNNAGAPDAASPGKAVMPKIIGKSYTMVMSNTGRIVEILGLDSMISQLFDTTPKLPQATKEMLKKNLLAVYGDSAVKKNGEVSRAMYPNKAVKEGDSWTVESGGGDNILSPRMKGVYTLDKVSKSEYVISNKSTLEIGNSNSAMKFNDVSMKYALSGKMTSNSKVDRKTGLATEIKTQQDVSGVVTIKTPSLNGQEIVMPMSIKGEIMITTVIEK